MVSVAGLALLLSCASALVVEEEIHPLRDVSPEEFHALALRQDMEERHAGAENAKTTHAGSVGEPAKPKGAGKKKGAQRNLLNKPNGNPGLSEDEKARRKEARRQETEKNKRQAKFKAAREKEMAVVDETLAKQTAEEAEIVEAAKGTAGSVIKANKTLACTENNKDSDILTFFVSQKSGGIRTKQVENRDKCMRGQLDEHCMPYESFPMTVVEQCDDGDMVCANKRVLVDHADCLTKNVDWDAIKYFVKQSAPPTTMWQILGGWCSHVKLLKEIAHRIQLDEQFVKDYPAILVLQDHVILDKEWTEEVARDWVKNYPNNWDMVQIDPLGDKGPRKDKLQDFRGKAVYRPSWRGEYSGLHAVLMKTKNVPTLLEKMQGLYTVPVDWLTKAMNDSPNMQILSWDAGISTVSLQGSVALKQTWMPQIPACSDARKFKMRY